MAAGLRSVIGLVAGFGRCGSSLVMAMLSAGGLPVVGHPPVFESTAFTEHCTSETFLRKHDGSILKWLDPTHTYLPHAFRGGPVLWLDRDPAAWAESHMKLRNMWTGLPLRHEDPIAHASLSAEVAERTSSVLQKIGSYGSLDRLRFEDILAKPRDAAETLRRVFRAFGYLDINRASAVVRERTAECAPGMEFGPDDVLASIRRTR